MIRCIDFGRQLKCAGNNRFGFYEIEKDRLLKMNDQWYWSDFYDFKKDFLKENKFMKLEDVINRLDYYQNRCPAWAK